MYINNINPAMGMGLQTGYGSISGFPASSVINYSFVPTATGWRAGASYPVVSYAYNPSLGWHSDIQTGQVYNVFGQPFLSGFSQPIVSSQFAGAGGFGNIGMGMVSPLTTGFAGTAGGAGISNVITSSSGMIQPRVELAETNSDVVVTAELPNINPNNLQLTVTDDSLSISALAQSGGMFTSLHRTVALPCSVRAEHVDATYSNGVLETRLPKSDLTARRRVKVNVTG